LAAILYWGNINSYEKEDILQFYSFVGYSGLTDTRGNVDLYFWTGPGRIHLAALGRRCQERRFSGTVEWMTNNIENIRLYLGGMTDVRH